MIDKIIFLKVPSFKHVYKWRLLQEKNQNFLKGKKTMDNNQIKNFIMFYERLTKHMLKNPPQQTQITIEIDKKHRLKKIKLLK